MSKDYWFPWSPARFRADTMHLSAEQDGIYRRLIDHYMETGFPLMDNDAAIYRIAGISPDVWEGASAIIRPFFLARDGKLHNKKCDEILADQKDRSQQNTSKSLSGAKSRWKSDDDSTAKHTRSQRLASARAKGSHSDLQWQALLAACGFHCCKCKIEAPLVKDHIQPLYQGGSDSIDNIQPLCRKCNSAKGPESTDYRPIGWRECLPSACPTPATRQDSTVKDKKESPPDPPTIVPVEYFNRSRLDPKISDAWLAECRDEMGWPTNVAMDIWLKFSRHQCRKIGQAALNTAEEWGAEWRTWYRKENIKPTSGAGKPSAQSSGYTPAYEGMSREDVIAQKRKSAELTERLQSGGPR